MDKKSRIFPIILLALGLLTACRGISSTLPPAQVEPDPFTPEPSSTPLPTQLKTDPSTPEPSPTPQPSSFTLTAPDLPADGRLPVEYTCDGSGSTLALAWNGAPAGTKSYAVIMYHYAPETIHWYWVLYNIPASVTRLEKNTSGVGTPGNNINNGKAEYSPPCSKGPGDKEYVYAVYALSAEPQLTVPPENVDRDTLLTAIKNITLATAEIHVVYARP